MTAFLETREGRRAEMRTPPQARDFMRANVDGWSVVAARYGGDRRGGIVAHRGVLHTDEYVDAARVLMEAQHRLGFTAGELAGAYCQGRKSAAARELRDRIDTRLLEVADAGGNMELLSRVFGMDRKTIGRALARARQVRREST